MTKSFFLLLLILLSCGVQAQDSGIPKVTATVGYGLLTIPEMVEGIGEVLGTGLSFGTVKYENQSFTGAMIAGVKFSTKRSFKFGADFTYEKFKSDVYAVSDGSFLGKSEGSYVTITPRADYYWLTRRAIRLYSGVGAGVAFAQQSYDTDKENSVLFAFNVVPLGFEAGGFVSFFAETSIGYNGLLNGGIRFRF